MDVVFDWNLGNMIYNGHNTLRLCGFPFAEIRLFQEPVASTNRTDNYLTGSESEYDYQGDS